MKLSILLTISCTIALVAGQQNSTCSDCVECTESLVRSTSCQCDVDCESYGDCCGIRQQRPNSCNSNASPSLKGLEFTCQSIYLDSDIIAFAVGDAFWMVASCPEDFMEDVDSSQTTTREKCRGSNELPPVTDTTTGIVYRNEFCAFCNSVSSIVAWQSNLACTQNVYSLLRSKTVSVILADDPTIFERECQSCSYQVPTLVSIPIPPRPCFPNVASCLNRSELNDNAETPYSQEEYDTLVDSCSNGPYDLVTGLKFNAVAETSILARLVPNVYRNRACLECNEGLQIPGGCLKPESERGFIPFECTPTLTPTTSPPTEATLPPPTTTPPPNKPTEEPVGLPGLPGEPKGGPLPEFPDRFRPPDVEEPPFIEDPIEEGPGAEEGIPFTIALSNLGGGLVTVTTNTERVNVTKDCPEGQAPVGLVCRPTICPQGFVESGGKCQFPTIDFGDTPSNISINATDCPSALVTLNNDTDFMDLGNNTVQVGEMIVDIAGYDDLGRPVICPDDFASTNCHIALVALNDTEFTDLGNDTIQLGDREIEVMFYDEFGRPLICPENFTTIEVNHTIYSYPEGFLYLTYIGCSLSVIGCALVLITYGLFKELRTLPGKILMNLVVTILMNNLFILIGGPVTQAFPNLDLCSSVAILLHFFFLAQFTWMSVMSFEMVRTFYRAKRLITDTIKLKRNLFVVYMVIGWSLPLTITTISIVVNYTTENLVLYGVSSDGTVGSCWINHFESAIIAFVVPLVISVVLNAVMFFIVTALLIKASISQAKLNKDKNIPYFRVNFAIFTATGLTWLFGFVALLARTAWCWYLFIIFNSTQGFMIFIGFLLSAKTLKLYLNLCGIMPKEKTTKSSSSQGGTVQSTVSQATIKLPPPDTA